jgi:cell division protein FtsQ
VIFGAGVPVTDIAATFEIERPTRTLKWKGRRGNRRVNIQGRAPFLALAEGIGAFGRLLYAVARVLGKVLLVLGLSALLLGGGRLGVEQVTASDRFALRAVEISPTTRISPDEVVELARITEGDRLLALDTDAIAARVAEHPWAAEVRVRRRLPSVLHFEVLERRAVATVNLGGLYLLDDSGRPFKRATMAEADGLPVLTGIERSQYVDQRAASEAAFREALAILASYRAGLGRPEIGEVNLSPRYGFTLFMLEGGAEIRLGRKDYDRKLARLDQILEAVKASGQPGSVRVVHLDGSDLRRVSVRLQEPNVFTLKGTHRGDLSPPGGGAALPGPPARGDHLVTVSE